MAAITVRLFMLANNEDNLQPILKIQSFRAKIHYLL